MKRYVFSLFSVSAVALLLGWGTTSAVLAQTVDARSVDAQHLVNETLGSNANAIDAWALNCPSGTHHAHFDVGDFTSGGPTIGILGLDFSNGAPAAFRRAPQGGISQFVQINGGPGFYTFYVVKTGGARVAAPATTASNNATTQTTLSLMKLHITSS